MAGFRVDQFRGIRPRRSALKLPEGEAQTAKSVKLGSGDLEPWRDDDGGTPVSNTYFNKTIHRFDNGGNPLWFEWDNYVSVARGSVKGDDLERTYYTGDGKPKMTYTTIANTGSGPYPASYRFLGIPAPTVAPTVTGTPLPETVPSDERRVISGSLVTKAFEAVFANFTVYPGTGTPDAIWNSTAAADEIVFDLQSGDSVKVTEVIDADTVRLGSATGSGAFVVTAANDQSSVDFYAAMSNNGSTRTADFTGWRVPDGIQATIVGHLLRVGDVIRVTRTDYSTGLIYPIVTATDYYEQNWAAPVEVTVDASTFFQVPNARIAADALGVTDFAELLGGFYYDIDRSASDSDTLEDRSYVYTFVSALGEEGPPSPASATVNALDGDTVTITGLEAPLTSFYEITKIRIYRTNATEAGTEFQFVKEIDVASNTSENVRGQNLGETLSTASYQAPPADMQGITEMPNGMMVGFVGKNIHMCEPYFPHAWPPEYDQAIDYEIVGFAGIGNSVAVLTEGVPYILTGSHPRNVNIRPFKINQACVSALSIASTEDRVMYASPDGLVEISINGARIVTDEYVHKDEWVAFAPTTIVGEIHDGKYYGFFDGPDNVTQPPATVFLSGTIVELDDTPTEADIQAGARTIILTLVSDTWVTVGALFDAQRQNIINGLLSSSSFITGWNNSVVPNIPLTDVVRTDDTTVTITLTARPEYSITATEVCGAAVPATALTGGVTLVAEDTFTVEALADYSTLAIAFTDHDAGGTEKAYAINSMFDITDWDSYEGVGAAPGFDLRPNLEDAAYSTSLNRWIAVGYYDATSPETLANTTHIATSDDDGLTWTARSHSYTGIAAALARTVAWYEEFGTFIAAGDNMSLQVSANGLAWSVASVDPGFAAASDINQLALGSTGSPYVYAAVGGENNLIRSPNLSLYPASNTWTPVPITYVSATGSKLAASGNAGVISVGDFNTDMEIALTVHGAATGASVGAISTYNCAGLTFGADTWVAVSDDFRIVTCDAGLEGTIGNWSAPSAAKFANTTIHGIKFDKGDTFTQGYGFIAFGVDTVSTKGVIYTSPDAVTWTLRHTEVEDVEVKALAVKYPESQLASVLLDFAPTYDTAEGHQADSFADYVNAASTSICSASTDMIVTVSAGDAIISVDGRETGNGTDSGSYNEAAANFFHLNERPDEVRITKVTESLIEGAGTGNAVVDSIGAPFIDGQFAPRPNGIEYGLSTVTDGRAPFFASEPLDDYTFATITMQFTFRKAGYNDLSVTYGCRARSFADTTGGL